MQHEVLERLGWFRRKRIRSYQERGYRYLRHLLENARTQVRRNVIQEYQMRRLKETTEARNEFENLQNLPFECAKLSDVALHVRQEIGPRWSMTRTEKCLRERPRLVAALQVQKIQNRWYANWNATTRANWKAYGVALFK